MSRPNTPTLALCLEYPIGLRGGVSILVRSLIAGLRDHFQLLVVSPDSPAEFRAIEPGVDHFQWSATKPTASEANELAATLANRNLDIAHFHLGGAYGWGNRIPGRCPIPKLAAKGVPVVTTVHSVPGGLQGYCGPDKPFLFKLAALPLVLAGKRSVLRSVRREIAVSDHDAQQLRRQHPGLSGVFERIYHSRIADDEFGGKPPDSKREPFILNVGHIAARKGQPVLARAFASIAPRFPDWELRFHGDVLEPKAATEIHRTAAEAGLEDRIRILPPIDEVQQPMRAAGIYVQPSLEEALGLALQEAMYCGCACVGSSVGGIPELINNQSVGVLVEPGNETDLANSIARLIGAESERQSLGRNAAQSIRDRDMTEQAMIRRHIELYESILQPE